MTHKKTAPRGGNGNAAHFNNQRDQYSPNLSPLESVLPLLTGARKNGDDYRANCPNPAHGDGSTKGTLAVSQGREGQLLLHCFSCADVRGILNGLGLELADLYPDRPKDMTPEGRNEARAAFKRSAWTAALGVLAYETTLIYECAKWLRDESAPLSDSDMLRLKVACNRIHSARETLQ